MNTCWPELELTAVEKQYVSYYATRGTDGAPGKGGVLRRTYPFKLVRTLVTGEADVRSYTFRASGRRTRVFAMTFSGDIEFWDISLTMASGEQLIPETGVTTILNSPYWHDQASSPPQNASNFLLARPTYQPCLFEPNILLTGTQALIVSNTRNIPIVSVAGNRSVLNGAFHVWEFEGMIGRGQL